jgi:cytidyltransferase-like protein
VNEASDTPAKRTFCAEQGIDYRMLKDRDLSGFPMPPANGRSSERKKVIVTGCYDWLHSGHVRFFEETSTLGDLYVVVGHDANVRLLKGEGHPMFSQEERRYMVQAIRHVTQALVSTGHGWMDAAPEIARIQPDIYAVNEDGDKPEKRAFCEEHGLEYAVLKRVPAEGLPRRQSTDLRGF